MREYKCSWFSPKRRHVWQDVVSLTIQGIGGGLAATAAATGRNPRTVCTVLYTLYFFQSDFATGWQRHACGHRIPTRCVLILNKFARPRYDDGLAVTICVYSACATEFYIRYFKRCPIRSDSGDATHGFFDNHMKVMSLALAFNTTCLFIRYVSVVPISIHYVLLVILILYRAVYRTIELSDGWTGRIIGTQVYFSAYFQLFLVPLPGLLWQNKNGRRPGRSDDCFGHVYPQSCASGCLPSCEARLENECCLSYVCFTSGTSKIGW